MPLTVTVGCSTKVAASCGSPLRMGWRMETGEAVSTEAVAGAEVSWSSEANPILKVPGLDVTLGGARVLDAPFEGDTRWWLGMRWRP